MAFQITPAVSIERDQSGVVRSLAHLTQPYTGEGIVRNARALADAYLRDVAPIYEFPPAWLSGLGLTPSDTIDDAPTELRFAGQQTATGSVTLQYQQTHFGLPIWEAGTSVTLLTDNLRATGSVSSVHPHVEVTKPPDEAPCAPAGVTDERLREILKHTRAREKIVINRKRLLVYRYQAAARLGRGGQGPKVPGRGVSPAGEPPSLPLDAVDPSIVDGRHYVVTEVLFDLGLPPRFPRLHWRAFIEVTTCSVLYLRPLIDFCTGSVYLTDPLTATGDTTITACSSAATLDPLRSSVTLEGLTPASPQGLTGAYVTVVGTATNPAPTVTPPPCDFTYSAADPNFAAVCAYYHVDELFRLVQSFGYDPITTFFQNTAFPLPVNFLDRTDVNSDAYPNASGNGFGGIDCGFEQAGCPVGIAADWRVTMHEFVHGMLDDRIHSGLLGFAHNGGDAFGAIYMDPGSKAPDRGLTFPWVPLLSNPADPTHYRRHDRPVSAGWAWGGTMDDGAGGYQAEQILSTTLFRIYRSTGGDSGYLDKQQLASRYVLMVMTHAMAALPIASTTLTTAPSYAAALMTADAGTPTIQGIPGGAIGKVVRWAFEKQGLYQPAGAPTPVTTPGAPPDVDVYIDDGRNGEYPYLEDFWENTSIWNLLSPNPATTPGDHQTPVVGVTNYAYVQVSNRGVQPANGVVVSGYHCRPSTGLLWPDDWQAMTTASIAFPSAVAPGTSVVVGPFEWTPTTVGHECMLMTVSATGDLSNADTASGLPCATGPTPHWRLVPFDNNIGQRNVAPVAGGGGVRGLMASFEPRRFWMNNPYESAQRATIAVLLPDFLRRRGWDVVFDNPGRESFTLGPRASREILLRLKPGAEFSPADVPARGNRIVVRTLLNGIPVGGMSYTIDPSLKHPPAEHPSRGEAQRCTEEAKDLLECLDVPVDEVKSVRIRRITVDIDLRGDC